LNDSDAVHDGRHIVTGLWKERPSSTKSLEYLEKDLGHRTRKELRFVRKLLKWPSFSAKGKLLRHTALAKKRPAVKLGRSVGKRFDAGKAAFLHDLRSRLAQLAEELGLDMQAARAFDAAADMRANLRVWLVDPWDVSVFESDPEPAFKAKDGSFCNPFDKHVRVGKVTTDTNAVPWVELLDTKTGTTQLYRAVDEDTGKPLQPTKDGKPSFLGRQLGMHNGSCVPASYAKVKCAGKPLAVQAQLREIQALEQREAALQKELDAMVDHGYDLVWYGRSGTYRGAGREKGRREVEKKYPEHVFRYNCGCQAQSDVIHGENYAAHIYGQVLHAYLGEDSSIDGARFSLEYIIAQMECRDGPCGDT